jgi:hypothetical protein
MKNEVESIFSENVDFLFDLEILSSKENIGVSEEEMKLFEVEYQMTLSPILKSYLKYYGKDFRKNIRSNEFRVFTLRSIINAIEEARKRNLESEIIKNIFSSSSDNIELRENINKVVPLYFINYNRTFELLLNTCQNPPILTFLCGSENEPPFNHRSRRLINQIRYETFLSLHFYLNNIGNLQLNENKLSKKWWFLAIQKINESKKWSINLIELIAEFQRDESLDFVRLDDFLYRFLIWAIEEKDIMTILDVFDPYYTSPSKYSDKLRKFDNNVRNDNYIQKKPAGNTAYQISFPFGQPLDMLGRCTSFPRFDRPKLISKNINFSSAN